jgi:GAF domain-containing protein
MPSPEPIPGDPARQTAQLEGLYRIAQSVMHLQDLPTLARSVRTQLDAVMGHTFMYVGLVEGEEIILYGTNVLDGTEAVERFAIGGGGLIAWVTAHGQPLLVNDVAVDPRYVSGGPTDPTCSELVVPIRFREEVLGVLDFHGSETGVFTEADLVFAESLASFLAVAVQNAQLYADVQRYASQLALVADMAAELTVLQPVTPLLEKTAEMICERLRYPHASIGLIEGEELAFKAHYTRPQGLLGTPLPRFLIGKEGITGRVAATGEAILVPDVPQDPRYIGIPGDSGSELAVPIRIGGRVLGVINVESLQPNAFTEYDLRLLQTLADQVAVTIHNVRLYAEAQRQADRLALVADIAAALMIPRPVTDLLETAAQMICERLGHGHAAIGLIEGPRLVFKAHYTRSLGFRRQPLDQFLVGKEGITGRVAATGEAALIPDVRKHPHYVGPPHYARSELAVPIRSGARVLGVINVESPQLNAFTEYDLRLIQTLADQVAICFVQERERIIRQQEEVIRELSTPVLQVRERLLILPIIGVIDAPRARRLTEQLLRSIRLHRAKVVVIDITGVPSVDATVADHLMQTVDASRLMGAHVIVTGLSSDIAHTLVTIGVDLSKIKAVGDLQGGIEEAERLLGLV